jgi:hypothetical protein
MLSLSRPKILLFRRLYLFICSLFNDAVSSSNCIGGMTGLMKRPMNWKGYGRERLWPDLK